MRPCICPFSLVGAFHRKTRHPRGPLPALPVPPSVQIQRRLLTIRSPLLPSKPPSRQSPRNRQPLSQALRSRLPGEGPQLASSSRRRPQRLPAAVAAAVAAVTAAIGFPSQHVDSETQRHNFLPSIKQHRGLVGDAKRSGGPPWGAPKRPLLLHQARSGNPSRNSNRLAVQPSAVPLRCQAAEERTSRRPLALPLLKLGPLASGLPRTEHPGLLPSFNLLQP